MRDRIEGLRKTIRAHRVGSAAALILSSVGAGFLASYWDKLVFERFTAPLAQWTGEVVAYLVTTALVLTLAILLVGGAMLATAWLTWRIARGDVADESGPAYWTLSEAISWIAFGEATPANGFTMTYLKRVGVPDPGSMAFILAAERLLFEALRDPETNIDVQGKELGTAKLHKPIPHTVFLSKVGAKFLDDSVGLPFKAPLQDILDNDVPKWTEVRLRRTHVLKRWPKGRLRHTLGKDSLVVLPKLKEAAVRLRDRLGAQPPYDEAKKIFRDVEGALESAIYVSEIEPFAAPLRDGARRVLGNLEALWNKKANPPQYGSDPLIFSNLVKAREDLAKAVNAIVAL